MGKRTIKVLPRSYQPTKAEMLEEIKLDATPEQLARSLLRPVDIKERDVAEYRAGEIPAVSKGGKYESDHKC